jgi:uncharacterized repeat protein (TIGR03803 family)
MLVVIIVIPVLSPGARAASNYKTLHKFTGGGLEESFAGLVFDQAGNLYGTTSGGGVGLSKCGYSAGCGTVFKLTPNADGNWRESVLYSFCSRTNCGDGEIPIAGLTFDQAGNLYGMTDGGGATGGGTAFKLTPHSDGSWTESVLYRFTGMDGSQPNSVILDAAGNLYGTTALGGKLNCSPIGCGVVFKLAPNSKGGWNEIVLHTFADHPGANPNAGLILDPAGNLYGTTEGDLSTTFGSVFEITP